jgi:hypothetical protein
MIGQMVVLLRIKELRQEQAFRAMRTKRAEVEQAVRETQEAHETVEASAATLPAREDAIYAEVLGRVIDPGEVDETRGKVVQLEKDHAALKDAWERAAHVQARLEGELEVVVDRYKQSTKARDKYVIITDDMKKEIEETANYREEAEVEDLFARPKRGGP